MGIDFSPIANMRPVNLAEIYGAADQANAQKQAMQYQQQQIARQNKLDQENDAVKSSYVVNPDGTLNEQGTFANLYKVAPQKALELQQAITQQKIAQAKADREAKDSQLGQAEKVGNLMKQSSTFIMANPTLDNAIRETQRFGQLTGANVDGELQTLQQIGNDPIALKKWAAGHALSADQLLVKPTNQDIGGSVRSVSYDSVTGQQTVLSETAKTATPDSLMTDKRTREEGALNRGVTMRGQNMVDSRDREKVAAMQDPASIESVAQMIANGQMPPLTGFAARSPAALKIMQRVSEINPNYSAIDYGTAKKASGDFATGKNGNTVRSLNVAVSHLDSLQNLANALNNGDVQAFNKIGNMYAQQTGSSAPTNFDTAKKLVADEVVKAVVGSGGGVTDREEAARVIQNANSPAQLAGAINTYKDLMRGQLNGFRQQYEQTTGKKDFDKYISSNAKAELSDNAKLATTKQTTFNAMPKPNAYVGKTILDDATGVKYKSDGKNWVKVQ